MSLRRPSAIVHEVVYSTEGEITVSLPNPFDAVTLQRHLSGERVKVAVFLL